METPTFDIINMQDLSFPKHRDAAVAFVAAIQRLVEALDLPDPAFSLSVNFHGPAQRIDVARLSTDGQHIAEWVGGLSLDMSDLETFGTPVGLPEQPGPRH